MLVFEILMIAQTAVIGALNMICMPIAAHAAPVAEATIDYSRTGSMDIYKYDLTNSEKDGIWDSSYVSTGVKDENGVEAAAYTMISMAKSAAFSLGREKVDFHLTRPFLYAIESQDGTVLFIGTVTVPDKVK